MPLPLVVSVNRKTQSLLASSPGNTVLLFAVSGQFLGPIPYHRRDTGERLSLLVIPARAFFVGAWWLAERRS